jgi:hypothetical protein
MQTQNLGEECLIALVNTRRVCQPNVKHRGSVLNVENQTTELQFIVKNIA